MRILIHPKRKSMENIEAVLSGLLDIKEQIEAKKVSKETKSCIDSDYLYIQRFSPQKSNICQILTKISSKKL